MSEESIPAGTTLLLKGGQALTPSADWHDPPRVDIAIADDKIVGVCPSHRLGDDRNVEVIDAHDHLVLPGFVNAHRHSHDVLAKGTFEGVPLETWRLYALPPQYPPRSAEEVYARTLLGALECLRSGMTTIQDMLTLYPYEDRHMDAVMKAYQEVGIRVVFALQYADRKGSKPFRSRKIRSRPNFIRCCRPPPWHALTQTGGPARTQTMKNIEGAKAITSGAVRDARGRALHLGFLLARFETAIRSGGFSLSQSS
jgi:cytosine/adenosine deaminase-related metal-dependent hydrolase